MGELSLSTTVTSIPELPEDLTGQIFGTIDDYVAAGGFGNVYRCEWRRPTGAVKVAVKVIKCHKSEKDLRRIRREVAIWARLVHENIVSLLGTTQGFGSSPALVSLWFPHGTLLCLIADKGGRLRIRSKLNLLHDIASGLHYLHCFPIVHGDLTSSNILVDIKEGEYKACLTDFGLSTVLGGLLGDRAIEGSTVLPGAIRWTAPELLRLAPECSPGAKPTKQHDMYSFGCVMYHILTLRIPWDGHDDIPVLQKILAGEKITRPNIPHATLDITDTRWNEIEQCWSVDAPARPSALMIMDFLTNELEALGASTNDDVLIGEAQESSQTASLDMVDPVQTSVFAPRCLSPTEMEDSGPNYESPLHETDELLLLSGSVGRGLQPQAETTTTPTPQSSSRITLPSQQDSPANTITLPPSATSSSLAEVTTIPMPRSSLRINAEIMSTPTPRSSSQITLPIQQDSSSNLTTLHSSVMASSLPLSRPFNVDTGSHYELPLSSGSVGHGLQPQAESTTTPIPRSSSEINAEIMTMPTLLSSPRINPQYCPSNAITMHHTATTSSLSLSRPFNVLIFGETGVGKSSVINLIAGQDVARTSPDGPTCTLDHTFYEISLDNHRFKLCEVSSIAPMNFFRRLFKKWRLKRAYKKLYKDDGVYLLLYCMRNSRAQGTLVRDYNFFASIVGSTAGHVPVAAVVTHLEDYPLGMDEWWKKNEENLKRQGMQFSKHACITSLPDDQDASPALRVRRRRSEQVIRSLICDVYEAGRASLSANSVSAS